MKELLTITFRWVYFKLNGGIIGCHMIVLFNEEDDYVF